MLNFLVIGNISLFNFFWRGGGPNPWAIKFQLTNHSFINLKKIILYGKFFLLMFISFYAWFFHKRTLSPGLDRTQWKLLFFQRDCGQFHYSRGLFYCYRLLYIKHKHSFVNLLHVHEKMLDVGYLQVPGKCTRRAHFSGGQCFSRKPY